MYCEKCGQEMGGAAFCSGCGTPAAKPTGTVVDAGTAPPSSPQIPINTPNEPGPIKTAVLVIASIFFWLVVIAISHGQALHRAGRMTAEAQGYMVGGCVGGLLMGLLAMWLVAKVRKKKSAAAIRFFGVSAVAMVTTMLSFSGSARNPSGEIDAGTKRQMGNLLREAAGKNPKTPDEHWWDGATREYFQDIIARNEQYIAEVKSLDSSATKDLYSPDSYAGKAHMEKIVAQLRAALAVEEKYASIDPVVDKMKERVRSIPAPETEKEAYLNGMNESMARALKPRNAMTEVEKEWMNTTIDLYEFMIANSNHYSIRDAKLFFDDTEARKGFTEKQGKAVSLNKDFQKAKQEFDESRAKGMQQMGINPADFTPAQMGKAH